MHVTFPWIWDSLAELKDQWGVGSDPTRPTSSQSQRADVSSLREQRVTLLISVCNTCVLLISEYALPCGVHVVQYLEVEVV